MTPASLKSKFLVRYCVVKPISVARPFPFLRALVNLLEARLGFDASETERLVLTSEL